MLYFNKKLVLCLAMENPMVIVFPFLGGALCSTFYSCLGITSLVGHLSVFNNILKYKILVIHSSLDRE